MRITTALLAMLLATLLVASAAAAEPATGTITGRIYDGESLRPVATTFVKIATAAGLELGSVGTDRTGRFRLEGVPPGIHRLYAWRGAEGSDPLPEIAIRPGETVGNVELVVRPRAVVRLRLETPSGRPATIERCVLESPPDVVEAVPRRTGTLELRASPGTWTLHVHARGFRTHTQVLELEEYDRRYLTVELSTGVSVVGRVLGEDGGPVVGALVERLRVDPPVAEGARWTTDGSGRFDLAGGVAAHTRFRVSAMGYASRLESLDLTGAGFIVRRDFVLKRVDSAVALSGLVVDAKGAAVAGADVSAGVPRSPLRTSTKTGADGSFRFEGYPDSDIAVRLEDPEGKYVPEETLARPGGDAVRLVRRALPVVELTVRHPDGTAPPLWRVRIRPEKGPERSVVLVGRDRERIALTESVPTVLEVDAPGHAAPRAVTVQPAPDTVERVTVSVDPALRTGTIAAWVLTRDDLPMDLATRLVVSGPEGEAAHVPNGLGGVVLRRLPAGRYRLRIVREGAEDDAGSPSLTIDLAEGGQGGHRLRADAALLVVEDKGEGEGPLKPGDGLTWAAGTRLEEKADLVEVLEFFVELDRTIEIEVVREGEVLRFRTPAASLKRYRWLETLR